MPEARSRAPRPPCRPLHSSNPIPPPSTPPQAALHPASETAGCPAGAVSRRGSLSHGTQPGPPPLGLRTRHHDCLKTETARAHCQWLNEAYHAPKSNLNARRHIQVSGTVCTKMMIRVILVQTATVPET
eukprot:354397-Rhodomonas_salina.1